MAFGPMPRALAAPASPAPTTATCASSVGPGIPHPNGLPSGLPGFHAQWYGQSGYPTLCPGERSTATVAYYNSGSLGWVRGRMGQVAYLGTWGPEPGQDAVTPLGGNGGAGRDPSELSTVTSQKTPKSSSHVAPSISGRR